MEGVKIFFSIFIILVLVFTEVSRYRKGIFIIELL